MSIEKNNDSKSSTTFLVMIGMSTAFLLVTPVLALLALGFFLDKFFHTTPILMLIGIGVGLIGGTFNVFRLLQAMQRRKIKNKI